MVSEGGQLYTIEGLAAGLIMIATAYIVLGATIVYTPGDTHIADMQLETLGNDVLRMMDTPVQEGGADSLETFVTDNNGPEFRDTFLSYCNARSSGNPDNLQMHAIISYRSPLGNVSGYEFTGSQPMTGREHTVRVTRWIEVDNTGRANPNLDDRKQMVLLEVLLWRA